MVNVVLLFVCVNLRDLREIMGLSFVQIDRVLLRVILPQIAQITQRNAASCIITQRKTGCLSFVVLGFVCVNQRDLREILGFTKISALLLLSLLGGEAVRRIILKAN